MKQVTIGPNDAGQRLDKYLTKTYPNLPQAMMYKSIRKKISNAMGNGVKSPPG